MEIKIITKENWITMCVIEIDLGQSISHGVMWNNKLLKVPSDESVPYKYKCSYLGTTLNKRCPTPIKDMNSSQYT